MSLYPVYLVGEYGEPRNHHSLWVQTADGRGLVYNVIGPVNNGAMQYETRPTYLHPSKSMTFVSMEELGRVSATDLPRMDAICRGNPAPIMQMRDGQLLYPDVPLRRCQEWTVVTIELLKQASVIVSE
ncbi:hypothetical protein IF1G_10019 [Cordyceps javanica]|uniref:Uncharacterized protein n=1 Tax=Cordyceps javanica TaxID=43265 RepID=A0A545UNU7_9HYPO|nr:hypothetical protein IF1G_10019 [Cordyceps javanica]TQW03074.1 hypothetical protein IF2G_09591 [Cordyceps javanica]